MINQNVSCRVVKERKREREREKRLSLTPIPSHQVKKKKKKIPRDSLFRCLSELSGTAFRLLSSEQDETGEKKETRRSNIFSFSFFKTPTP
jgi:hypothetical protein